MVDSPPRQILASHRDENVLAGPGDLEPTFEVGFKLSPNGRVEREQPALAKLRASDHKSIGSDVIELQVKSLRDTEPRAGKETKECAVDVRAKLSFAPNTSRFPDDRLDISRRKKEGGDDALRDASRRLPQEADRGDHPQP